MRDGLYFLTVLTDIAVNGDTIHFAVNYFSKYTKYTGKEMGTGCVLVVKYCLLLNNLIFGI